MNKKKSRLNYAPYSAEALTSAKIIMKKPTTENDDNEQDKHFEHVFVHSLILGTMFLVVAIMPLFALPLLYFYQWLCVWCTLFTAQNSN